MASAGPASSSTDPLLRPTTANPPGILYSLIARDRCVVVEYSPLAGNFTTVTRMILEKLPSIPQGQKRSYQYDQFVFHYFAGKGSSLSTGVTFLCLADKSLGRDVPYRFLEEVCSKWTPEMSAVAMQVLLKVEMERGNSRTGAVDPVSRVRAQIAEASEAMIENIDKIIQRQEKIELLVEKSSALDRTAAAFRREAVDMRRSLWWRNVRFRVYGGLLVCLTLLIAGYWWWKGHKE